MSSPSQAPRSIHNIHANLGCSNPAADGTQLRMNRSRLLAWAALLAAPVLAAAQPAPFAPPSGNGSSAILLPPSDHPEILTPAPVPHDAPPAVRALNQGWVFGADIDVIRPHFRGDIVGGPLDTTVSPGIIIGYEFPSTRAILFEYRYFGASGDNTFHYQNDPAPSNVHRHTEGHVLDFDIRFREDGAALLKSQWEVGIRAVDISVYGFNPSPNWLSLVSNRFNGAGPHLSYQLAFTLFDTGFEVFALGDVGVLYGKNRGFSQVPNPPPDGPRVDLRHDSNNAFAWTLRWEVGASYWFRWGASRVSLAGGYGMDAYDFVRAGQQVVTGGGLLPVRYDPGDVRLVNTGPFVRFELRY